MTVYVVTTIDELMGSRLVPVEHWVHRKGADFREYKCASRAEAELLAGLLNELTPEQCRRALAKVCEERSYAAA